MSWKDDPRLARSDEKVQTDPLSPEALREAAQIETAALEEWFGKNPEESDLAIRAIQLWYRAGEYGEVERLAYRVLASPHLGREARILIQGLLQRCWVRRGESDEIDLVERSLRTLRSNRDADSMWVGVKRIFSVGRTRARAICVRYGHDPDRIVRGRIEGGLCTVCRTYACEDCNGLTSIMEGEEPFCGKCHTTQQDRDLQMVNSNLLEEIPTPPNLEKIWRRSEFDRGYQAAQDQSGYSPTSLPYIEGYESGERLRSRG